MVTKVENCLHPARMERLPPVLLPRRCLQPGQPLRSVAPSACRPEASLPAAGVPRLPTCRAPERPATTELPMFVELAPGATGRLEYRLMPPIRIGPVLIRCRSTTVRERRDGPVGTRDTSGGPSPSEAHMMAAVPGRVGGRG